MRLTDLPKAAQPGSGNAGTRVHLISTPLPRAFVGRPPGVTVGRGRVARDHLLCSVVCTQTSTSRSRFAFFFGPKLWKGLGRAAMPAAPPPPPPPPPQTSADRKRMQGHAGRAVFTQ